MAISFAISGLPWSKETPAAIFLFEWIYDSRTSPVIFLLF